MPRASGAQLIRTGSPIMFHPPILSAIASKFLEHCHCFLVAVGVSRSNATQGGEECEG